MRPTVRVEHARGVPDRIFDEPRLADIYDYLDSDRSDLDMYMSIARAGRSLSG
jgi:hypothetical protein